MPPPRARPSVQFRQLLVPELLKLVGDPKSNTIEAHTVVAYAGRLRLLLDKQQVLDMFAEADFKHEGRLGVMQLVGALEGRSATGTWSRAALPALSLLSCCDVKGVVVAWRPTWLHSCCVKLFGQQSVSACMPSNAEAHTMGIAGGHFRDPDS